MLLSFHLMQSGFTAISIVSGFSQISTNHHTKLLQFAKTWKLGILLNITHAPITLWSKFQILKLS